MKQIIVIHCDCVKEKLRGNSKKISQQLKNSNEDNRFSF